MREPTIVPYRYQSVRLNSLRNFSCNAFSCQYVVLWAIFLSWYFRTIILFERPTPKQVRFHYRFCSRRRLTLRWKRPTGERAKAVMETQLDIMSKTIGPNGSGSVKPAAKERRGSRRCKITQLMRLRPSDPERDHFDDMRGTLSVSRSGVYFQTSEAAYEIGMRLFVTLPYSQDPVSMNREYLAEVVRRDPLPTGMFGVGLKLLMEIGMQRNPTFGYDVFGR